MKIFLGFSFRDEDKDLVEQVGQLIALHPPDDETVIWTNIDGLYKGEVLKALEENFGLHPLLITSQQLQRG